MQSSIEVPQPIPQAVSLIDNAGGLKPFLFNFGQELINYYNEQLEGETDEGKRQELLVQKLQAEQLRRMGV